MGSQRQQGAALVLVLALLSGSLMLGLSGMSGSLVNERLAGNYRASVMAQMHAETTAAEMFHALGPGSSYSTGATGALGICPSWAELDEAADDSLSGSCMHVGVNGEGVACYLDVTAGFCGATGGKYILAIGSLSDGEGGILAESPPLMVGVTGGYHFDDAIVGCEEVRLAGGAGVTGGIVSGGDVDIDGGVYPPDSIVAAGMVKYPNWWDGDPGFAPLIEDYASGIPFPGCDPYGLYGKVADLRYMLLSEDSSDPEDIRVGDYPTVDSMLTPTMLTAYHQAWDVEADVTLATAMTIQAPDLPGFTAGEEIAVIRTGDFTSHNGSLTVSGGNVVLFVEGDLTLGAGGGDGLIIEPGSTLTVIVAGETNFKGSLQTASLPLVTNGRPTFALYSTHIDNNPGNSGGSPGQSGIVVDGSARALANIYAPGSNVSIVGGGGVKGTVRGKRIRVTGGGSITSKDDSTEAAGKPKIVSWH
ncbi:hypothetical protein F0A17_02760 [Billgrantia pellis]|uniref:DUF7305 domain-containing protein n=1 Tax=Billgrantia pellis TaxID=2606936 RepID=A0A7V7KJY4_9GAMM|nr:hypothetical protein [Halomonas pellis]KAA0014583.1 hypothetical protein F0A17_02760 [Halomonas pellis]